MQRAARISQRLTACYADEATTQLASLASGPPVPEPMQITSARLSRTERARRLAAGLCLYCAASDHLIRTCPVRPPRPVVSTIQLEPDVSTLSLLSVQLLTSESSVPVSALVDSGSSGNFISKALLTRLNLPRKRQPRELRVETIQGKPLGRERVNYQSPSLTMRIGCLHEETISFLVQEGPTVDIILGCPWLTQHSPEVIWDPCEITRWSDTCFQHCLSSIPKPLKESSWIEVCSSLVESPEPQVKLMIPSDYQVFQDVFSKQAATRLPPHRPWDCAIDLLPGAKPPKGKVYPLSIPERKAMEDYIQEALQQDFIWPSTSLAALSFFFVDKKDRGLRPCIDYRTRRR